MSTRRLARLAVLLAVLGLLPAIAAAAPDDAARLQAENAQLKAQVQQLAEKVQRLEAENKRLTILAGIAPQSEYDADLAPRIKTETNPETKAITVTAPGTNLTIDQGTTAVHVMDLNAVAGADGQIQIRTWFSGQLYVTVKSLDLTLDGQALSLPVTNYESRLRTIGAHQAKRRADDEFLTIAITREQMQRIGNADSVKARLGRVSFTLSREQLALFRAVALRDAAGKP